MGGALKDLNKEFTRHVEYAQRKTALPQAVMAEFEKYMSLVRESLSEKGLRMDVIPEKSALQKSEVHAGRMNLCLRLSTARNKVEIPVILRADHVMRSKGAAGLWQKEEVPGEYQIFAAIDMRGTPFVLLEIGTEAGRRGFVNRLVDKAAQEVAQQTHIRNFSANLDKK
jgi:hypothetical protein